LLRAEQLLSARVLWLAEALSHEGRLLVPPAGLSIRQSDLVRRMLGVSPVQLGESNRPPQSGGEGSRSASGGEGGGDND
jgi:hypothetical protein